MVGAGAHHYTIYIFLGSNPTAVHMDEEQPMSGTEKKIDPPARGRKPIYDKAMKRKHVHFTDEQWAHVSATGDASAFVRTLVDNHMAGPSQP